MCCGGRKAEVGSGCSVSERTEEETSKLGVTVEVGNAVVLALFGVVVVHSGFTIHSSDTLDHWLFLTHLMRLEVPALLTYPSMHL